jgi:hypothetical protein
VINTDYALFLVDADDDPVLTAPGAAESFQFIVQWLRDSPRILAEWPGNELEDRPRRVQRNPSGWPRLTGPQHSGRKPDSVSVTHALSSC